MANAAVIELTESNFAAEVEQSTVPVLVDFWAEWCGPCKMIAPVIDQLAAETQGRFKVAKVDVTDNQGLAQKYGISGIPALLFFKDGQLKEHIKGGRDKAFLLAKLESLEL